MAEKERWWESAWEGIEEAAASLFRSDEEEAKARQQNKPPRTGIGTTVRERPSPDLPETRVRPQPVEDPDDIRQRRLEQQQEARRQQEEAARQAAENARQIEAERRAQAAEDRRVEEADRRRQKAVEDAKQRAQEQSEARRQEIEKPTPWDRYTQAVRNKTELPEEEEESPTGGTMNFPKQFQVGQGRQPLSARKPEEPEEEGVLELPGGISIPTTWEAFQRRAVEAAQNAKPFSGFNAIGERVEDWYENSGARQQEYLETQRALDSAEETPQELQARVDELEAQGTTRQYKNLFADAAADWRDFQKTWLEFRQSFPQTGNTIADVGTFLRNKTIGAWFTLPKAVATEPLIEGGTSPGMFLGAARDMTVDQMEALDIEDVFQKATRSPVMFGANLVSAIADYYAPGFAPAYNIVGPDGNSIRVNEDDGTPNSVPSSRPAEYVKAILGMVNEVQRMPEGEEKDKAKLLIPGVSSGFDHIQRRSELLNSMPTMISDLAIRAAQAQAAGDVQTAAALGAQIEDLQNMSLTDIIDITTDPVMEILEGVVLDPLNLLDAPISALSDYMRVGRLGGELARRIGDAPTVALKREYFQQALAAGEELVAAAAAAGGMIPDVSVIRSGRTVLDRLGDVPVLGKVTDLVAPTRSAEVRKITRDATRMAGALTAAKNITIADTRRIMRALAENPEELMMGMPLRDFDSPSIRAIFSMLGDVRFGENIIASKDAMAVYPVIKAAAQDIMNSPYLRLPDEAAIAKFVAGGGERPETLYVLNKPGFIAHFQAAIDDAASRMYGINSIGKMDAKIPVGSVSFRERGASKAESLGVPDLVVVEYFNRHGDKLGQSGVMYKASAADFIQKATSLANAREPVTGARTIGLIGDVQRSIMNVTYLGMPRNWIRNAANAFAGTTLEGAMAFKTMGADAAFLEKKLGLTFGDERVMAGFAGSGGTPGAVAPLHGERARNTGNFWQRFSDKLLEIPYSNKSLFGVVPFGEQRWFTRVYTAIFEKFHNRGIKTAIDQNVGAYLRAAGVDKRTIRSITQELYEVAVRGDKQDFMAAMRRLLYGDYTPVPMRDLGIEPSLLSPETAEAVDTARRNVRPARPTGGTTPPPPDTGSTPIAPSGSPAPSAPTAGGGGAAAPLPTPEPPGGGMELEDAIKTVRDAFKRERAQYVRSLLASGVSPGSTGGILSDAIQDAADFEQVLSNVGKLLSVDPNQIRAEARNLYTVQSEELAAMLRNLNTAGTTDEAREIMIATAAAHTRLQYMLRQDVMDLNDGFTMARKAGGKNLIPKEDRDAMYAQWYQDFTDLATEYKQNVSDLYAASNRALSDPTYALTFTNEADARGLIHKKATEKAQSWVEDWRRKRIAFNTNDEITEEYKRNVINAQTQYRDAALLRLWDAFTSDLTPFNYEQFVAAEERVMQLVIATRSMRDEMANAIFGALRQEPWTVESRKVYAAAVNRIDGMENRSMQAQADIYNAAADAIYTKTTRGLFYKVGDQQYQYVGRNIDGLRYDVLNKSTGQFSTVAAGDPNAPPASVVDMLDSALKKKQRKPAKPVSSMTPTQPSSPQPVAAAAPPMAASTTPAVPPTPAVQTFTSGKRTLTVIGPDANNTGRTLLRDGDGVVWSMDDADVQERLAAATATVAETKAAGEAVQAAPNTTTAAVKENADAAKSTQPASPPAVVQAATGVAAPQNGAVYKTKGYGSVKFVEEQDGKYIVVVKGQRTPIEKSELGELTKAAGPKDHEPAIGDVYTTKEYGLGAIKIVDVDERTSRAGNTYHVYLVSSGGDIYEIPSKGRLGEYVRTIEPSPTGGTTAVATAVTETPPVATATATTPPVAVVDDTPIETVDGMTVQEARAAAVNSYPNEDGWEVLVLPDGSLFQTDHRSARLNKGQVLPPKPKVGIIPGTSDAEEAKKIAELQARLREAINTATIQRQQAGDAAVALRAKGDIVGAQTAEDMVELLTQQIEQYQTALGEMPNKPAPTGTVMSQPTDAEVAESVPPVGQADTQPPLVAGTDTTTPVEEVSTDAPKFVLPETAPKPDEFWKTKRGAIVEIKSWKQDSRFNAGYKYKVKAGNGRTIDNVPPEDFVERVSESKPLQRLYGLQKKEKTEPRKVKETAGQTQVTPAPKGVDLPQVHVYYISPEYGRIRITGASGQANITAIDAENLAASGLRWDAVDDFGTKHEGLKIEQIGPRAGTPAGDKEWSKWVSKRDAILKAKAEERKAAVIPRYAEPELRLMEKDYHYKAADMVEFAKKNWAQLNSPQGLNAVGLSDPNFLEEILLRNGYEATLSDDGKTLYVANAPTRKVANTEGGFDYVPLTPSFAMPTRFSAKNPGTTEIDWIKKNWQKLMSNEGMTGIPNAVRDVLYHNGYVLQKGFNGVGWRVAGELSSDVDDATAALPAARYFVSAKTGEQYPEYALNFNMTRDRFRTEFASAFLLGEERMDAIMALMDAFANEYSRRWNLYNGWSNPRTPEDFYRYRIDQVLNTTDQGNVRSGAWARVLARGYGKDSPFIIESFFNDPINFTLGGGENRTIYTALHELSHVWTLELRNMATDIPEAAEDFRALEAYARRLRPGRGDVVSGDRFEIMADALVRWTMGEPPSDPRVAGIITRFRTWLEDAISYLIQNMRFTTDVRGTQGVKDLIAKGLPPEVQDAFTRAFGGKTLDEILNKNVYEDVMGTPFEPAEQTILNARKRGKKDRGTLTHYTSTHDKGVPPVGPKPITDTGAVGDVVNGPINTVGDEKKMDAARIRMMAASNTASAPALHDPVPDVNAVPKGTNKFVPGETVNDPSAGLVIDDPTPVSATGNENPSNVAGMDYTVPEGTRWNDWRQYVRANKKGKKKPANDKWIEAWYWYLKDNAENIDEAMDPRDRELLTNNLSALTRLMTDEWGMTIPSMRGVPSTPDPNFGEAEAVAGFSGSEYTSPDSGELALSVTARAATAEGGAPEHGDIAGKTLRSLQMAEEAIVDDLRQRAGVASPTGGTTPPPVPPAGAPPVPPVPPAIPPTGGMPSMPPIPGRTPSPFATGTFSGGRVSVGVAANAIPMMQRMAQDYDNVLDFASRMAGKTSRYVMLEPNDTRGFDNILRMVMPYHYFWSRSAMNWARRIAEHPEMWNMYQEVERALDQKENRNQLQNQGLPQRGQRRLQVPGTDLYITNPLDIFLPYNSYMGNEFVDPEAANNAFERNWLLAKRHTPVGGPIVDAAVAGVLDYTNPLPEGVDSRLSQFGLADIAPQARWFELPYQILTGKIAPTAISGDPYMYGLAARQAAVTPTPAGTSPQEFEALRRWAIDVGTQIMDGIPALPEQPAEAEKLWEESVKQSGGDKLLAQFLGMMMGLSFIKIRPEELSARQFQAIRRAAGYGDGSNAFGSRAAMEELDATEGPRQVSLAQYPRLYPQSEPNNDAETFGRPGATAAKLQRKLALEEEAKLYASQKDAFIEANLGRMETGDIYSAIYDRDDPNSIASKYQDRRGEISNQFPSAELVPSFELTPEYFMEMNPSERTTFAEEAAVEVVDTLPQVTRIEAAMEQARVAEDWDTFYELQEQLPLVRQRALASVLTNPNQMSSFVGNLDVDILTPDAAMTRAEEILTDTSYRSEWENRLAAAHKVTRQKADALSRQWDEYFSLENSDEKAEYLRNNPEFADAYYQNALEKDPTATRWWLSDETGDRNFGKSWTTGDGRTYSASGSQIGKWWDEYGSLGSTAEKAEYLRNNPDFAEYYYQYVKEKYGETEKWWETYTGGSGYSGRSSYSGGGGGGGGSSGGRRYYGTSFGGGGGGGGGGYGGGYYGGVSGGVAQGGGESQLLPSVESYASDTPYIDMPTPPRMQQSQQIDPYRVQQAATVQDPARVGEGVDTPAYRLPDWESALAMLRGSRGN